jgi:hypothetical protein
VALAVPDEGERKKQLEKIVRERYADLFALDLSGVTPSQLIQQIGTSYGNGGDTRDKAVRFFLGALGYLDIPVSRFVNVPKTGNGSTARRRRAKKAKLPAEVPPPPPIEPRPVSGSGEAKVIKLASGGTLTLIASLSYMALNPADRKFFNGVLEMMEKYEAIPPGQSQANKEGEE